MAFLILKTTSGYMSGDEHQVLGAEKTRAAARKVLKAEVKAEAENYGQDPDDLPDAYDFSDPDFVVGEDVRFAVLSIPKTLAKKIAQMV